MKPRRHTNLNQAQYRQYRAWYGKALRARMAGRKDPENWRPWAEIDRELLLKAEQWREER